MRPARSTVEEANVNWHFCRRLKALWFWREAFWLLFGKRGRP